MDVALQGPADAQRLLILSSACHGVEGFCGSGVQVFAGHDREWCDAVAQSGITVLYIHALNPHGFSFWRRVTHENVDLNRNFQDFSQPLPDNPGYAALHSLLLPEAWPPNAANQAAIDGHIAQHGMAAFQTAVSQGQHRFPDGLFFGGQAPTWSNTSLRQVLRRFGARAQRVGWIDLHTGLGEPGLGERIFAGRNDPQALARTRSWWGGSGATPITSFYDGSSTSAELTGLMWYAIEQECPQAEYTGIALEYGTQSLTQVISALRADHWLHLNPQAQPALQAAIKQQILDAFYVDTDAWRGQVVAQARQALFQGLQGLSG